MSRALRSCALIALLFVAGIGDAAPNASDATAIRSFLGRIYGSYKECPSGRVKCPEPIWQRAFTSDTRRLIALNEKLNDYGAGAATEADPICQCQDYGTIKILGVTMSDHRDGRVKVEVRFTNLGRQKVSLVLEKTPAGWRVFDVLGETAMSSYRERIIAENRSLAESQR